MSLKSISEEAEQKNLLSATLRDCMALATKCTNHEGLNTYTIDREAFIQTFISHWLFNEHHNDSKTDLSQAFGSFVFVFQKNLDISNITLPEHLALFRYNRVPISKSERVQDLLPEGYFSTRQYREYFTRLIPSVLSSSNSEEEILRVQESVVRNLVELHLDFLVNTCAISYYHTSCVMHIPRTLRYDLITIVGESGYIHSMGRQIYVSRVETSSEAQLDINLKKYREIFSPDRPLFAAPYCSEFFESEENQTAYSMQNGLSGIKISGRKSFIGAKNVLDFFAELSGADGFYVPQSSNYIQERTAADETVQHGTSILLFTDYSLDYSKTNRKLVKSNETYYICYAQLLKFGNKLSVMKERKPGWTGPVTIPHTLSAAIVNISRSKLQRSGGRNELPVVFDPFCGSSTFLLDAAIRLPGAKCIGFDRQSLFFSMNKANLKFFSSRSCADDFKQLLLAWNAESSDTLADDIGKEFDKFKRNGWRQLATGLNERRTREVFPRALAALLYLIERRTGLSFMKCDNRSVKKLLNDESFFSPDFVEHFDKCENELVKLSFFVCWRAFVFRSFRLQSSDRADRFVSVVLRQILTDEIRQVILELSDLEMINHPPDFDFSVNSGSGSFYVVDDTYSPKVCIRPNVFDILSSSSGFDMLEGEHFGDDVWGDPTSMKGLTLVKGDSIELMNGIVDRNRALTESGSPSKAFRPNLIITDPPYNFNMNEGDLEELFFSVSYGLANLVAPGGVVSVVLPSFARNGRTIPFYQSKEVFVRRFLSHCNRLGRSIVSIAETGPDTTSFPRLPYYWNSQRGVSRHILCFTVE